LRAEIPLNPSRAAHVYVRHDEASLIRLAQRGDAAACAALYDRHYDAVYRYCFYRVGDAEVAQDLAGDVFVRMVERLDAFRMRGRPLLTWLYTIACNLVDDLCRDNSPADDVRRGEAAQKMPTREIDPSGHVDPGKEARRLAAAMKRLTEEQRRVILLKFMQDLDNATVAHILGTTDGAIDSLQYRALAALGRTLHKENCHDT
jgi:RNA polymerase sigma-70 factor, ECF subfamily